MSLLTPQSTAVPLALPRAPALAALVALRPRQWTKNLILFAGLLFAKRYDEASSWLPAIAIFGAYCAVSSAAYLVNDVRDAEHDRLHPTKRFRPVASGELRPGHALAGAAVLTAIGLTTALVLGTASIAFMAAFAGLQAGYSLGLKRLVLVDVLTIAGLFMIRAAAGAAAVQVRISPWLLVCTALLALFLGLAKRRSELVLVAGDRTPGRPVLERYSLAVVERLVWLIAASVVGAYTLYALTARDSQAMVTTVPLVVFGLLRYLYLMHRHDLGEEPEQVLLTDRAILACVGCWAVIAVIALAAS